MNLSQFRKNRIMRGEIIITRKTETVPNKPSASTAIKALSWVGSLLLATFVILQWGMYIMGGG